MKILHVLDHSVPIQSGYSFRTLEILKQQRNLGWNTCHVTGVRQHEASDKSDVVDGFYFNRTDNAPWQSIPLLKYFGMILANKRVLTNVIKAEQPDIIHVHSPALNGIAALWATRSMHTPLVYEIRAFWEDAGVNHGTVKENGLRYRLTRSLETYVIRKATAVTTICDGLKNDIIERGISTDKVTVIPNAVNIERFPYRKTANSDIRSQWGLNGYAVVGFVGSFYEYEGLDLLIEAFAQVLQIRPDTRLLLVGGEEQEVQLKQLAETLGVSDAVIFTGRVPHDLVAEYYSVIDILVYPRKSMRLTELVTPLKPLEALALGKLLVLSDVGGHKEIASTLFENAKFPAGNRHALTEKIVERLDELDNCEAELDAGRHYVESERNWRVVVDRYKSVYQRMVG